MVVLVEVSRKPYLASLVPVIVNAILNEHQIIVDIVAFVSKGDFPRSRLGEKQRGKILAGWVTKKLRTLAQFTIRDLDPASMGGGEMVEGNRLSASSIRSSGVPAGASSLRNVEPEPSIPEHDEQHIQSGHTSDQMLAESGARGHGSMVEPRGYAQGVSLDDRGHEFYPDEVGVAQSSYDDLQSYGGSSQDEPPRVGRKPVGGEQAEQTTPQTQDYEPPRLRMTLPGVDGREGMQPWRLGADDDEEEDWTADAIMTMNLAGDR